MPRFAPVTSKNAALYPSTGTTAGPAKGLGELRRKLAMEAMFVAAIGSAIKEHIADCWRYRKLY